MDLKSGILGRYLSSAEQRKRSLSDRCNDFFVDSHLLPLLVQENYLRSVESQGCDIRNIAHAADLFVRLHVVFVNELKVGREDM